MGATLMQADYPLDFAFIETDHLIKVGHISTTNPSYYSMCQDMIFIPPGIIPILE